MGKRMNKKGSLDDLVYILGVVLFFGLLILIFGKVSTDINTEIQANDQIEARGKAASQSLIDNYTGTIDNSMLFLVIGLMIGSLLLATLVVIHPIFFVFYVILLSIVVFVSGVVSNIYQQAASTATLQPMADSLLMTSTILQYLPFIIGVFGFLLAIIMYKTYQNNQF